MAAVIRRAENYDIPEVMDLLFQVNEVHHIGRPDLFKTHNTKYKSDELEKIFADTTTPVFVFEEENKVKGYVFCVINEPKSDFQPKDLKTLYIDDLCVDEKERGKHIGKKLCDCAVRYAKSIGCHNVTLNVWACNLSALEFYNNYGFKTQKIGMEIIL